jgi:ABC-type uncharacterized transport system involved in gliding motility auxiliary subunit
VAQQFGGLRSFPITILQAGDRREETTGLTEQDFTSALLKLASTEQKKIYFVQGHEERDPDGLEGPGYNSAAEALRRENYLVEQLRLFATQRVPDDAAVVVIAGPRTPLFDEERQALENYLARGGHVLLLADPESDPGLSALLDKWYVKLGSDIVIDPAPSNNLNGDVSALLPLPVSGHRISSSQLNLLVMPRARSVSSQPGAGDDFAVAPILRTSEVAWGETNFGPTIRFDPGQDVQGPITVALAVSKVDTPTPTAGGTPVPTPTATPGQSTGNGRLLVVGNAEFASNTWFRQVPGNRDFFINSINWLAEEENLISIRAEPAVAPPVILTNQARVLVFYTSVLFVPLAVLLLGATVWWQRR